MVATNVDSLAMDGSNRAALFQTSMKISWTASSASAPPLVWRRASDHTRPPKRSMHRCIAPGEPEASSRRMDGDMDME